MTHKLPSTSTSVPHAQADHFGRRLSARLDVGARGMDHAISERLRVAREGALARMALQPGLVVSRQGAASVLSVGGSPSIWAKVFGLMPVVVLLVGLFCIDTVQDQYRADELADVDVELLTAELPPLAFTDPGFVYFLRATGRD
jgi:hypothetical protein